jgi:hypothetical protein
LIQTEYQKLSKTQIKISKIIQNTDQIIKNYPKHRSKDQIIQNKHRAAEISEYQTTHQNP